MRSKKAGGLNRNAVQMFNTLAISSPDNSVVKTATRLDGLLNNSGENQFDGTQPIRAGISLCTPSSAACHFLDTRN